MSRTTSNAYQGSQSTGIIPIFLTNAAHKRKPTLPTTASDDRENSFENLQEWK